MDKYMYELGICVWVIGGAIVGTLIGCIIVTASLLWLLL